MSELIILLNAFGSHETTCAVCVPASIVGIFFIRQLCYNYWTECEKEYWTISVLLSSTSLHQVNALMQRSKHATQLTKDSVLLLRLILGTVSSTSASASTVLETLLHACEYLSASAASAEKHVIYTTLCTIAVITMFLQNSFNITILIKNWNYSKAKNIKK